MRLVQGAIAAAFFLIATWSLVIPAPESDAAVLLVWLLCAVAIGFVVHRWWALPLAFGPGLLSSLYQRTVGGGAGDGQFEAWQFIGGMIIFGTIIMVTAAAGWGIWRALEIRFVDRLDQAE